jgi:hypothetical protein
MFIEHDEAIVIGGELFEDLLPRFILREVARYSGRGPVCRYILMENINLELI